MIELILSIFKEGDCIKISFNNSTKTVEGEILKILSDSIAIKTSDGKIHGVRGVDINSFEQVNMPENEIVLSETILVEQRTIDTASTSCKNNEVKKSSEKQELDTLDTIHIHQQEQDGKMDVNKLKPGDVIPLDQLNHIDPKLKAKKFFGRANKGKKLNTIGKDLSALASLVEEEHEIDDLKIVPALGEIKLVFPEKNFGFIFDGKSRKNLYFSLSQIVDGTSPIKHQPVVYSRQEVPQGEKAITIHRPMSIKAMLNLADSQEKEGQYLHALHLVEQILEEYSDNFHADTRKSIWSKNPLIARMISDKQSKTSSNYYSSAKKYHAEKDYQKAIEYYLKAIENDVKKESSIKDLGMLYASLHKSENDEVAEEYRIKAIQLMEKYSDEFPDTISTWNYLENFYYAVEVYDSFLIEVDKLLELPEITKDKVRHLILLNKKSVALVQLKRIQEALDNIDDVLDIDPANQSATKLKSLIEDNPNDIANILREFDSLTTGGISTFIMKTIEDYDEYTGVPAKIIESQSFSEITLREVQRLTDTLGKARSRERAQYLLTQGKLITIIDPENMVKLRNVMARYCNAMALNHISDYSAPDITRFYYNEAFSLEETYRANATQIPLYLLTHYYSNNADLLNMTSLSQSVDDALSKIETLGKDVKCWESILSMFLYNRQIPAQIIPKLYRNDKLRDLSLWSLERFGITGLSSSISKDDFVEAWTNARNTRLRDYRQATTQIKLLGDSSNIEDICSRIKALRSLTKDWMTTLDLSRIDTIINNIQPAIETYLKSTGYRNKEANKNSAMAQISLLIEDIIDGPTKLSYEAILPLLQKISGYMITSFNEVIKMSTPKISIKLLSSKTVVNDDNVVFIQVSVSNHKDSSPIKEVSVNIVQTDMVNMVEESETTYNAIDGGESLIFTLKIMVGSDVIAQKATTLDVICKYKSGNDFKETISKQSLLLYSSEDYCPIENPYAPLADGGPVPMDSNMFYGREDFISNIVDAILKSPSKQIIIYGQKRCGKSSVMLHLKKKLMETGKAFCVFFSLGEIIGNLTETTFYHKILSTIYEDLEFGQIEGTYEEIPEIVVPSIDDFKREDELNPLNTFMKYMTKFKLACKKTKGWEKKNLVVMVDEFTYLYTEIKKGEMSSSIMKQWKAITQSDKAQFSVVLVGQDVVPSFKKEDYAKNAFGVIQDIRLTYLKDEPARDLIEKPILDSDGKSRYIEGAVSKIIEYTSRNPYYIQIFCSRLVDFMNANKLISVTEADVENVARSFVEGSDALVEDKFDNLIRAGETEDLQEFPESEILSVLRQIALNSKNIGFCNRHDINAIADKQEEDEILKHLTDREVLEKRGEVNYKIQVKLFQEWLLNH